MRPQQQNRRMRGRNNNNNNNNNSNNNNRKGPNPLTRNYESNGPDVKIRGSAQQIAEKYSTLARDAIVPATVSWPRTICSTRNTTTASSPPHRRRCRSSMSAISATISMTTSTTIATRWTIKAAMATRNAESQQPVVNGSGPQPVIDGTPAEVALNQDAAPATAPRDQRPNGSQTMATTAKMASAATGARAVVAAAVRISRVAATATASRPSRRKRRNPRKPEGPEKLPKRPSRPRYGKFLRPASRNSRFPLRRRSNRTDDCSRMIARYRMRTAGTFPAVFMFDARQSVLSRNVPHPISCPVGPGSQREPVTPG